MIDQAHNKRNHAEYKGVTDVDVSLVEAIIRVAFEIEERLAEFGDPPDGFLS